MAEIGSVDFAKYAVAIAKRVMPCIEVNIQRIYLRGHKHIGEVHPMKSNFLPETAVNAISLKRSSPW